MESTVDILMATYNGEKYISEQIESILQQTHSNIKLIICDDISTDRSPEVIQSYAQKFPEKITIVKTETKLGANQCFGLLLKHATNDYIMFSDQDDVWFKNKVERSLKLIRQIESQSGSATPVLVHSDLTVVDNKLNVLSPSFWGYTKLYPEKVGLNRLLVQNVVTGCTMMFNRAAAAAAQPFPETIVQHDWWVALVTTCLGQISYIPDPLIYYRQHNSNSLGAQRFNMYDYWKRINSTDIQENNYRFKNRNQALVLKERIFEYLSPEKQKVLDAFLGMQEMNFLKQLGTCVKYRFCYHGIMRNLAVFMKKLRQAALAKIG